MARYIMTGKVMPAAIQAILKSPSDREVDSNAMMTAIGGRTEAFYFSPFTLEAFSVANIDDAVAIESLMLAVGASGTLDPATIRLIPVLTGAELADLARRTDPSLYRPPGA